MGKRGKTVSLETRQKVLKESKKYGPNYLASHFSLSENEIYKILRQERNKPAHFAMLSKAALKLADILDWYYKHHQSSIDPLISSDFPYSTHTIESPTLSEQELSNLTAHLKDEKPDLVPIAKYNKLCKQWFALGDKKWEMEIPSASITEGLILELRLKANQGVFPGKCPNCPR